MDISVALCTYNAGKYLSEQLDSLIAQTRQPDEIVVFDDNSDDGTWSILRDYEERYPALFEIHQNESNLGITKNFETCIRACSGDGIAICDQDDIWVENKLEAQISHLSPSEPILIHHNSQIVNENMERIQGAWQGLGYDETKVLNIDIYFDHLIDRFSIPGHTMLFSKALKDHILPIPDCFKYDLYIAIVASLVGDIYAMPDRLVNWRHHDTAVSNRPAFGALNQVRQILRSILQESSLNEKISQWEVLKKKIDKYESNLTVDVQHVRTQLKERIEYDSSRATIYSTDSSIIERLSEWVENIYFGRYWRVKGRKTIQLMIKDLVACIVLSIYGTI